MTAPGGKVTIDPATHHCTLDVQIARGEGPGLERARDLPAAAAGRHRRGLRPEERTPNDNKQYVDRRQESRPEVASDYASGHASLGRASRFARALSPAWSLISLGLAVIFGMMRVINLAHGEFLMLGGYAAIIADQGRRQHLDRRCWWWRRWSWRVIGIVVERLLIRFLYGRMIDTMLATWGLSLLLIGLVTTIFGNVRPASPRRSAASRRRLQRQRLRPVPDRWSPPSLSPGIYLVLSCTRFGLIARGTMQNPDMAAALGVAPRVYSVDLRHRRGARRARRRLLAPVTGVVPTIGAAYIAKAFITVISGGAAILAGTLSASALLGAINQLVDLR